MYKIKLLAIDTATDACSVAVYLSGKILEHYALEPRSHTRLLLAMVDQVLNEAGISLGELDTFAFGRGPGSFTGIRIACSVIQALSFGLDKPVVPVSTLQALAQQAYRVCDKPRVFASLDARLEAVYWALFEKDAEGIMQPVSEERVEPFDQIVLPAGDWYPMTGYPHAQDIAQIAAAEYRQGRAVSAEQAFPVYVRDEVVRSNTRSNTRS